MWASDYPGKKLLLPTGGSRNAKEPSPWFPLLYYPGLFEHLETLQFLLSAGKSLDVNQVIHAEYHMGENGYASTSLFN